MDKPVVHYCIGGCNCPVPERGFCCDDCLFAALDCVYLFDLPLPEPETLDTVWVTS